PPGLDEVAGGGADEIDAGGAVAGEAEHDGTAGFFAGADVAEGNRPFEAVEGGGIGPLGLGPGVADRLVGEPVGGGLHRVAVPPELLSGVGTVAGGGDGGERRGGGDGRPDHDVSGPEHDCPFPPRPWTRRPSLPARL